MLCLNSWVLIVVFSFDRCVLVVVVERLSLWFVVDRLFSWVVFMNSWMLLRFLIIF